MERGGDLGIARDVVPHFVREGADERELPLATNLRDRGAHDRLTEIQGATGFPPFFNVAR